MARKPGAIVNLRLRLPEALRRQLAHEAEASNRSLNSEILWRLGQTFSGEWQQFIARVEEQEQKEREFTERMMANPDFRERLSKMIATWVETEGKRSR